MPCALVGPYLGAVAPAPDWTVLEGGSWSLLERLTRDGRFATTAHTDDGLYRSFAAARPTPMDLFVDRRRDLAGYNTHLGELYELGGAAAHAAFAHGLDPLIAPERVLERAEHRVPAYTVEAMAARARTPAASGHRRVHYAGAWLGNGLHEGAAASALAVSDALGGRAV